MTLGRSRVLSSDAFNTAAANHNQASATVNLTVKNAEPEVKAVYEQNPYSEITAESTTEKILKLILDAYVNNPLIVNSYVIMQNDKLLNLVKTMTNADSVELDLSTDVSCCGKPTKYNYIGSIVIVKDNSRNDFKISYNKEYRLLKDYRISTKMTID